MYGGEVALHPEGVDRNPPAALHDIEVWHVALHPEGVDRNMRVLSLVQVTGLVALHPEGVDRNAHARADRSEVRVRSPSTRRAWIEIYGATLKNGMVAESPSTRRAWIEIHHKKNARK